MHHQLSYMTEVRDALGLDRDGPLDYSIIPKSF